MGAIVVLLALSGAGPPDADAGTGRYERELGKALRKQGLDLEKLLRCRTGAERVSCRFRALGTPPGKPSYECEGKAVSSGERWRIRRCGPRLVPLGPESTPLFGYNEDWIKHETTFDLLAASGANVARQTLVWRGHGAPDFAEQFINWDLADRLYAGFLARGIRPVWVLFDYYEPHPGQGVSQPSPTEFDDYARAAARVAQRYPQSAGIEVWNEPNLDSFWNGPDPTAYGALVGMVGAAVDAVNPDMPVVAAGLFPVSNPSFEARDAGEFLRRAYETGGLQAADAIGAHPYPTDEGREGRLENIRALLYEQLKVMSDFGDADKPIWVTETGVSTAGGNGQFTPEQQADALTSAYSMLRRVSNVPVVVFHRFVDAPAVSEVEAGFGVVDSGGVPKPAYCALARLRDRTC